MLMQRRAVLTGFAAMLAAPAVVRAGSLMKIVMPAVDLRVIDEEHHFPWGTDYGFSIHARDYSRAGRFWRPVNGGEVPQETFAEFQRLAAERRFPGWREVQTVSMRDSPESYRFICGLTPAGDWARTADYHDGWQNLYASPPLS